MRNPIAHPWKVAIALFATAVVLATWTYYGAAKAEQSLTWPSTAGIVKTADAARPWWRGRGYVAVVEYTYSVGGTNYESDRVSFQHASESRIHSTALKLVQARFVPGHPVDVFYDPADPSTSILRKQAPDYSKAWIMLIAVSSLGLINLFGEWYKSRN